MAKSGQQVNETIVVHGSSTMSIVERLMISLRGEEAIKVTNPSTDSVVIARVFRSGLSKKTEMCTVTAVSEPQRLVVTLSGVLLDELVDVVRAAISGRSLESVRDDSPVAFAPQAPPATTGTPFVPPASWFVTDEVAPPAASDARPAPEPTPSPRWVAPIQLGSAESENTVITPVTAASSPTGAAAASDRTGPPYLQLPDGRTVELGGSTLVGRAPTPKRSGDSGAGLVHLNDPSVSANHLFIEVIEERVWVTDRRSTNRSRVVSAHGGEVELPPFERFEVSLPAQLRLGEVSVRIMR